MTKAVALAATAFAAFASACDAAFDGVPRARAAQDAPPARPAPQDAPAPAPPRAPSPPEDGRRWIVGDLHVHVTPPDAPGHSAYDVAGAVAKARELGLDFVVLTPHDAHASFGPDETTGGVPLFGQELVARQAAAAVAAPPRPRADGTLPRHGPIVVVSGWEFTRGWPGHLNLSFFRMEDVSRLEGDRKPEEVVAKGGLAVVNHPFLRPVRMTPILAKIAARLGAAEGAGDWRWKPFFGDGQDPLAWNAIEVFHDRSYMVEVAHRDVAAQFPDTQMVRAALEAWDRATREQRRRIVAVGGSDCHGKLPYTAVPMKMTGVAVASFDEAGLRDGLVGARATFGVDGGLAARDFAATSDVPGARAGIGDSLAARSEVRLTWSGKAVLYEDGVRLGEFDGGTTRKVDPPGSFRFWRIEKPRDAYSNMIYANLEPRAR